MSDVRTADRRAEVALVAAILAKPERASDFGAVKAEHFSDGSLGLVFGALQSLAGTTFDTQDVRASLSKAGHLSDRVDASVKEAFASAGRGGNAEAAAEIIRGTAVRRALLRAGDDLAALGREAGVTSEELLARAEALFLAATARVAPEGGPRHISAFIPEALQNLERAMKGQMLGVSTGIPRLDELTGGFQPGWLVIVGGRTSHGKSSLAVQGIDWHVALRPAGGTALLFTLEMRGAEIAQRRIQTAANVTGRGLRLMYAGEGVDDLTMGRIAEGGREAWGGRLYVDDQAGISIETLCQRARRFKAAHPDLSMVTIDNLQNFGVTGRQDKRTTYDGILRRCKELAKELMVPVVLLVQLSRELDRENREPVLADFRDTGAIEAEADLALLIHRYGEQRDNPTRAMWPAKLIIGKGRSEGTGFVETWFHPRRTEFTGVADLDVWNSAVQALSGDTKPASRAKGTA